MSFALLLPLGLLALAAWALPLLLHLARREQQQPTDFAALRWLSARLKPRQRLRFEEWPLLALRLALLATLALLLARPVLTGVGAGPGWLVVHPSLPAPVADDGDRRERRWLAPGFPPLTGPAPAAPVATASLLRQLDAELPAAATLAVRLPTLVDGADGAPVQLSRAVDWQVVDAPAPAAAPAAPARAMTLAIRHDDAHAAPARYLRAVAAAWATAATPAAADADATSPPPADIGDLATALPPPGTAVVAWLGDAGEPAALRAWVEAGGTALHVTAAAFRADADGAPVARDDDGGVLASARALGRGRIVVLHRPLQPAELPALLDGGFPQRLRGWLQAPAPAPTRIAAAQLAPRIGGPGFAPLPRPLDPTLVLVVIALFALERLLASGRRAEPSP